MERGCVRCVVCGSSGSGNAFYELQVSNHDERQESEYEPGNVVDPVKYPQVGLVVRVVQSVGENQALFQSAELPDV